MQIILNFIYTLIPYAVVVLVLYLFVSLFFSNGYIMAKTWFKKLFKTPELSIVLALNIIVAYPFIFLGFIKEWSLRNKKASEFGWSIILETIKQLHVDLHDKRRDIENVFFLGWKHLIGFHLPILILWVAIWVTIINYTIIKFF